MRGSDEWLININIGWAILIGLLLICVGFLISAFLSGSKIGELDTELRNEKIINNRKDKIIEFYKSSNINDKSNNTIETKERKNK